MRLFLHRGIALWYGFEELHVLLLPVKNSSLTHVLDEHVVGLLRSLLSKCGSHEESYILEVTFPESLRAALAFLAGELLIKVGFL